MLAQLVVGQELLENTGGDIAWIANRLYIQPGVMIKFGTGSALDVLNPAASLNVGSRSYINGYDQNNDYSPTVARLRRRVGFRPDMCSSRRFTTTTPPRPWCPTRST